MIDCKINNDVKNKFIFTIILFSHVIVLLVYLGIYSLYLFNLYLQAYIFSLLVPINLFILNLFL